MMIKNALIHLANFSSPFLPFIFEQFHSEMIIWILASAGWRWSARGWEADEVVSIRRHFEWDEGGETNYWILINQPLKNYSMLITLVVFNSQLHHFTSHEFFSSFISFALNIYTKRSSKCFLWLMSFIIFCNILTKFSNFLMFLFNKFSSNFHFLRIFLYLNITQFLFSTHLIHVWFALNFMSRQFCSSIVEFTDRRS